MSAISVSVSRVPRDVNPYIIPELLRSNQNNFVTDSLPHSRDSLSPHSSSGLDPSQFGSGRCRSESYRVNAKHSKRQPQQPSYPICTCCQQPIAQSYLYRIRGQTWHEGCATCSVCSGELTDVCFLHEGRLFCPRDYDRLHAIKCTNCRQPMRSHELFMRAEYPKSHQSVAGDDTRPPLVFHVSCFTCCVCQQPLSVGDPYTIDPHTNRPICRTDYLSSRDASESSVNRSVSSPPRPVRTARSTPHRRGKHEPGGDESLPTVMVSRLTGSSSPTAEWSGHVVRTGDPNWKVQYSSTGAGNRRIRTSLTDEQRLHLQKAFELSSRPSKQTRERLAQELGVPTRVVQVWFQNQRARDKRAAHSNRSWNQSRPSWSRSQQPVPDSHPSPTAPTPSPRTSVESGSYPEFGGFSVDEPRQLGPERQQQHLASPKQLSDSQPWRPAWLIGTETDPTT